jgi:hypothetical protein
MSQKRGRVFTWPDFACFRDTDVESKRNVFAPRTKMGLNCESQASWEVAFTELLAAWLSER